MQHKYTYQVYIAGYRNPEGTEVQHADSLREIARSLLSQHERGARWGAAYAPSDAIIWRGHLADVTDIYPDRIATTGPRGGVRVQHA